MEIPEALRSPVNKALFRLSTGDMTSEEMRLYLADPRRKNTGFSDDIAEQTVSLLEGEGYLDDLRYLKNLLEKMDRALYGPRKIKEELKKHRFPPRYVEAALARRIDYERRATKLLMIKLSGASLLDNAPLRKKMTDFLVRRGYDYSTAKVAVDRVSPLD